MPSPSPPWLDPSHIEAPVGSHADEIFGLQYNYGFDRASPIFAYPYNNGIFKRLSRSDEKRTSALFAAFASLVAIVMLIYTCKLVYNRKAGSLATRRRLSDDGSDYDAQGFIACEESDEEDMFIVSSPTTSGTTSDGEDEPERSSKVPRLETGGKRTAKTKHLEASSRRKRKRAAAKRQRGSASEEEGPGTSQKAGHHPTPQPSTPGWLGAQQHTAGEPAGDVAEQTADLTPQHPVPGPHTQHPVTTSAGIVLIQHSPVIWSSHTVQRTGVHGSSLVGPQPQPSPSPSQAGRAAVEGAPGETPASAVGISPSSTEAVPVTSPPRLYPDYGPLRMPTESLLRRLLPDDSGAASSDAAAASPSQPPGPQPSSSRAPAAVQAPSMRRFDPTRAMQPGLPNPSLGRLCCRLRELLAREPKDTHDRRSIVVFAEAIIKYVRNKETKSLSAFYPCMALYGLTRRYLALYLLVSALPLLGESSDASWWKELVSLVPHEYTYKPELGGANQQRQFNLDLARRLSAALAILKTGVLPAKEEISCINRMLFHSPMSPTALSNFQWDPWRQMDRDADRDDDEDGGGDADDA